VNWHSRRAVLALIVAVCLALFVAGMGAAFLNRHDSICSDGKDPVAKRAAILGQVAYRCHDGEIVTLNN
jgi:hypothetical protein